MTYELKRINIWSAIKVSFMLHAILGLVVGLLIGFVFALMFSLMGEAMRQSAWDMPLVPFGPLGGLFIGLGYAVFIAVFNGVIITGIIVILYNLAAGWLGGLRLEFEASSYPTSAPSPGEQKGDF